MAFVEVFSEILGVPTFGGIIVGLAFLFGVLAGWAWKPRWACLRNCKFEFSAPSSPSVSIRSPVKAFSSIQSSDSSIVGNSSFGTCILDNGLKEEEATALPTNANSICSLSELKEKDTVINDEDLEHLYRLVEKTDGGPCWKHMMDRSTDNMSYQAWQRDPETGPPQYRSRTVYEDATPELLRDFFCDDEFRLKWDDMLIHAKVLEECPTTGSMVVHWIRKFPFFCSDREYLIGRRIWEFGRSYYTVTKGVPYLSVPRKDKPRRVDLYYSSWYIQAVESRKGDEQLTACEVILFHHEDMGIPWEIAKFGVRQGMWGAVRNIERGFRAYQKYRASGAPLSHHAIMAQINTKADLAHLKILGGDEDSSEKQSLDPSVEKPKKAGIPKILIIGGAVVVACSLDRGLLTKTLIFGIAKRFGNIGRGAFPRPN